MPTALPRFQVTETAEVARALRIAEKAWPELTRGERVKLLLASGAENLERRQAERAIQQISAVHESSGMFSDLYDECHREQLRDEWPE